MFEPVVKWSGSKRSQAEEILGYFPKKIGTYYEPFCGGASVLRRLLSNSEISVDKFICSDLNADLINLWNEIKENPEELYLHYEKLWSELNKDEDIERKKAYFGDVRDRYNAERSPKDFLFIMRTTTNGMPRYNKEGQFNNSFHVTRNGIVPKTLYKVLAEWSEILNNRCVEFRSCDYSDIKPISGDFLYLDPPYAATKGMYFGNFDNARFFDWLRGINCGYILSYDGISGKEDNTYALPKDLYDKHIYIRSGNSSFKRVIGKSNDSIVYESLYCKA